ncbi:MAG TPA: hypothetical protein VFQ67_17745 [Allosphingosinicella sp.]|jgi:hypothetical protein|nr:hypothetical protein [Allosphingosinicella sp.]
MPSPLTLGHILLAAAVLEALAGAVLLLSAARNSAGGPGTPAYARARDRRRAGLLLLASAAAFAIIGLLTPIAGLEIG